ncbi:hypothetical protein GALMADRAFT_150824 [Galerina marginata CBS 339.88]|uniref:C2H2-type domain-containing protein n=1 Tax=Galerina marginata (strain CBS 339.88) TaxID=685588 RepID=A0A067TUY6_GALM3|nr:hypothetical protein GALMADRAFT_150824 [Galerina marginata CBS 339.88]
MPRFTNSSIHSQSEEGLIPDQRRHKPPPSLDELWAKGRLPGIESFPAPAQLADPFSNPSIRPIELPDAGPTKRNHECREYRTEYAPYPSDIRQRLAPLNFEQVRGLGLARRDKNTSMVTMKRALSATPEQEDCAGYLGSEVLVTAVDMGAMRVEILGEHTKWLEYAVELGKVDGRGNPIYQCLHEPVDPKMSTLCNFRGLKQTVKRHINATHLGIRPWVCSECSKSFPQKSALGIHINAMHVWTTQYECPHCKLVTFKDPAARHRHITKEHKDKPIKARKKDPYAGYFDQLNVPARMSA